MYCGRKQDRLLNRLRDPRAGRASGRLGRAATFDALQGAEYALLVTFRRSADPVPTAMWFGLYGRRVHVRSLVDAGKVKRLQNDPHVRIAPCTIRRRPTGPFTEALGRIGRR